MTIGFGFQCLTLHFVIPNHGGTKLDNKQSGRATDVTVFCYVIFTCNKKEVYRNTTAVAVKGLHSVNSCENIKLNQVGTVLHYQIVHQKWKSVGQSLVRRVCVVTDDNILLLDEDYFGDGCECS
jgi:hypothetical protein